MSKDVLGFERKNIAVTSREILRCCQMISARMSKLYKYSLGQQLIMCASKLTSDVYAGLDEIGPSNRKLELVNRVNMDILELLPQIRVVKDLNEVNGTDFEEVIRKIKSTKNQVENWRNYIITKQEEKNGTTNGILEQENKTE